MMVMATNVAYRARTAPLGMLFTHQVTDLADATISKISPEFVSSIRGVETSLNNAETIRNDWMSKVADIHNQFYELTPDDQKAVNHALETAVISGIWPYATQSRFESEAEFSQYLDKERAKSTERNAEVDEVMDAWDALNGEAQDVVKAVLEHGRESLRARANAARTALREAAEMKKEGANAADIAEIEKSLKKEMDKIDHDLGRYDAPYVPLRRFGDFIVVRRSKEYAAQEKLVDALEKAIKKRYGMNATGKQRAKYFEQRAVLEQMATDADHYAVETYATLGDAQLRAKEISKAEPTSAVSYFPRKEQDRHGTPTWQTLEKIIQKIADDNKKLGETPEDAAALEKLEDTARYLYIRTLRDTSARKSELRRRKISGYHENMMESFTEAGRAEATLLGNMATSGSLRRNMSGMYSAARKIRDGADRTKATIFANEMTSRMNVLMKGSDSKIDRAASAAMRATSVQLLLTKPAYYIDNLTQPFVMSAPYMAGRFGSKVYSRLTDSVKETGKWLAEGKGLSALKDALSAEEFEALDRARDAGHIDIGMTQDFGRVSRSNNKVLDWAGKVSEKMTQAARKVEIVNRVSTFLTAYRLAKESGMDAEAAYKYADEVIITTHGNYSNINAPRYFNANAGLKIATQFKKFVMIQLGMHARMMIQAVKGATPEERAIARRSLAWTYGTLQAVAGLNGSPLGNYLLMPLINLIFGDEGEDDEETLRRLIGDKTLADLLIRGVPMTLGVDLSERLGAANLLDPFPFYEWDSTDPRGSYAEAFLTGVGGAVGSIGTRMADGLRYMYNGDYLKALERMAPTGVSSLMQAGRLLSEGLTTRSGDMQIPGEDFTIGDIVTTGLGYTSSKVSDQRRLQSNVIRHEKDFSAQYDRIRRDYDKAYDARDYKARREAEKAWREIQKQERAMGFRPTPNRLYKSVQDRRKREGRVIGGVVSDRRTQGYLKKRSNE